MKPTIAILTTRNFDTAPRVIREIETLKNDFNIFLIGDLKPSEKYTELNFRSIYTLRTFANRVRNRFLLFLNHLGLFQHSQMKFTRLKSYLIRNKIDVVIIHEASFLEVLTKIKKSCGIKVIFNAHEYHPLEFEDVKGWLEKEGAIFERLYRKYLIDVDLLINVCESIREKCLEQYKKDSIVIPNAALKNNIMPCFNNNSIIKLVHHGVILPSRKIEDMIKLMNLVGDNYQLDIIGVKNKAEENYFDYISILCDSSTNVRLIEPYKFEEIIPSINKYDIGLFLLYPVNFNNSIALPNKLFEFIQAKLAILISPSIEMKKLVEKYNVGRVSEEFSIDSMVETLQSMNREEINEFKNNTILAAEEENAEKYQAFLKKEIAKLF